MTQKIKISIFSIFFMLVAVLGFLVPVQGFGAQTASAEETTSVVLTTDNPDFIGLAIVGKSGGSWKIKVTNVQDFTVNIEYNTKMCFGNDAQRWKDLVDLYTFTLKAGKSETVAISQNGFAGYIAFSFFYNNVRYITYAHNLDKDDLTLTILNTTISIGS